MVHQGSFEVKFYLYKQYMDMFKILAYVEMVLGSTAELAHPGGAASWGHGYTLPRSYLQSVK
jgi:hypothetical protein